jgi:hypothetical protein
MSHRIIVGDTVAYSDSFLNHHNRYPGETPSAKGKVKTLHYLDKGIVMADIEWNKPGLPKRVNAKNLTRA